MDQKVLRLTMPITWALRQKWTMFGLPQALTPSVSNPRGAGMALSQWMDSGEKPFDLGDVDISRMNPFQGNKTYLFERSKETLGLLYADHFPYRQKATARGIRRTPFHHHLDQNGAVFGELADGNARTGSRMMARTRIQYSWKRQNWFENSAREHRAIRENVGMYDMSSFGKSGLRAVTQSIFKPHLRGEYVGSCGKIVYTQFLNERAGIEADVTVTRLSETAIWW